MSRSVFLFAASALVLSACGERAEQAEPIEAADPPVVVEEVIETEIIEADAAPETVVEEVTEAVDTEAHDHAEDADHDNHAEDSHDHEDDHDHAGGEAHVHGHADLAVSTDGNVLSISLEAPLDNFGLPESQTSVENTETYSDGIVRLVGEAACERTDTSVEIRTKGDHASMIIDLAYACADASGLSAVELVAFENFSGFEEVDAIVLTDDGQSAMTLTKDQSTLTLR